MPSYQAPSQGPNSGPNPHWDQVFKYISPCGTVHIQTAIGLYHVDRGKVLFWRGGHNIYSPEKDYSLEATTE